MYKRKIPTPKNSAYVFLPHFNASFFLYIYLRFCPALDIFEITSSSSLFLTALSQNLSFLCSSDRIINVSANINGSRLYWMLCYKANPVYVLGPKRDGTVRTWPNSTFVDNWQLWSQFGPILFFDLFYNFFLSSCFSHAIGGAIPYMIVTIRKNSKIYSIDIVH